METTMKYMNIGLTEMFKSYYVVWKHARGERMYENPIKV